MEFIIWDRDSDCFRCSRCGSALLEMAKHPYIKLVLRNMRRCAICGIKFGKQR